MKGILLLKIEEEIILTKKGLRSKSNAEASETKEDKVVEKLDKEYMEEKVQIEEDAKKDEEKALEDFNATVDENIGLAQVNVHVSEAGSEKEAKKIAKELDVPEIQVTTTKSASVRVKSKNDIRTYIGDQWYNLKAGKVETVPSHVKEILRQAGVLDTI
jgi:hypothetical protein